MPQPCHLSEEHASTRSDALIRGPRSTCRSSTQLCVYVEVPFAGHPDVNRSHSNSRSPIAAGCFEPNDLSQEEGALPAICSAVGNTHRRLHEWTRSVWTRGRCTMVGGSQISSCAVEYVRSVPGTADVPRRRRDVGVGALRPDALATSLRILTWNGLCRICAPIFSPRHQQASRLVGASDIRPR